MTNKKLKDLMTRKQAAQYLEVSPNTLALWDFRKTHDLKPLKLGRSVRYRRSYLDAYLENSLNK